MKMIKYIIPAFLTLMLVSCFEDKSTDATRRLSEIVIDESSMLSEYNIHKNEVLVIEPVITQTNKELPLSYTWEVDQKVVSTEEVLVYTGDRKSVV